MFDKTVPCELNGSLTNPVTMIFFCYLPICTYSRSLFVVLRSMLIGEIFTTLEFFEQIIVYFILISRNYGGLRNKSTKNEVQRTANRSSYYFYLKLRIFNDNSLIINL